MHLPRSRRPVDYYTLLDIPADATFRDIEQAYWQTTKTKRELLSQLNEAYEVLGDPNRRLAYDEQRAASKDETPRAPVRPIRPSPDRNKLRWYAR